MRTGTQWKTTPSTLKHLGVWILVLAAALQPRLLQGQAHRDPEPEGYTVEVMSRMHFLAQAWEVAALVLFSIVANLLLVTLCMGHYHHSCPVGHRKAGSSGCSGTGRPHGGHDHLGKDSVGANHGPLRQLAWSGQQWTTCALSANLKRKLSFALSAGGTAAAAEEDGDASQAAYHSSEHGEESAADDEQEEQEEHGNMGHRGAWSWSSSASSLASRMSASLSADCEDGEADPGEEDGKDSHRHCLHAHQIQVGRVTGNTEQQRPAAASARLPSYVENSQTPSSDRGGSMNDADMLMISLMYGERAHQHSGSAHEALSRKTHATAPSDGSTTGIITDASDKLRPPETPQTSRSIIIQLPLSGGGRAACVPQTLSHVQQPPRTSSTMIQPSTRGCAAGPAAVTVGSAVPLRVPAVGLALHNDLDKQSMLLASADVRNFFGIK